MFFEKMVGAVRSIVSEKKHPSFFTNRDSSSVAVVHTKCTWSMVGVLFPFFGYDRDLDWHLGCKIDCSFLGGKDVCGRHPEHFLSQDPHLRSESNGGGM